MVQNRYIRARFQSTLIWVIGKKKNMLWPSFLSGTIWPSSHLAGRTCAGHFYNQYNIIKSSLLGDFTRSGHHLYNCGCFIRPHHVSSRHSWQILRDTNAFCGIILVFFLIRCHSKGAYIKKSQVGRFNTPDFGKH